MPRPHYRHNPSLGRKHTRGLKIRDDISGRWCYWDETTLDADGNRVYVGDKRTLDRRPDLDDENEAGR